VATGPLEVPWISAWLVRGRGLTIRTSRYSENVTRPVGHEGKRIAGMASSVLFLCVHNSGRSQMAAGWLSHIADGAIEVFSGGSEPAEALNPLAVQAMAEIGIDIAATTPRMWTDDDLHAADVIITMGCGDICPVYRGKRYEDWQLIDPADQPIEVIRTVRDDIERRVRHLVATLNTEPDS